ncbi:MAG TPA: lysylphosphatidylglycerol synthase transmembrane domain-containing protein [Thermoleophilaceae bacterium]|nr:lysylphosphatidylglycerol synthase transmembrane domain-containing protein [Thermoleophilaceae bacterium]
MTDEHERLVDLEEDARVEEGANLLRDRRRLLYFVAILLLGIVAIYVVFPKIAGFEDSLEKMDDATWYWIVVAIGFNVAAFGAYVALFRGILGGNVGEKVHERLDLRASYQITMAGLAATRIFSAAGAGGLVVTYWALRKAGMERRRAACRMVAFLALTYVFYLVALILFGVLLRTGVLPGSNPSGGTIVPASVAGVVLVLLGLVALIPGDVERRLADFSQSHERLGRIASKLAKGPATLATGVRTAIAYVRHPGRGFMAVAGALGFWAANIGILWASFEAYGGDVPFGVMVQGFFVGMAANLIPSPAGGVGSVDAGMIAAFVLFDVPTATVFAAVLTYRVIAFWLPIPPGIIAYVQLRNTVSEWEAEDRGTAAYTSESKVTAEATT